jgi:hypothetical protein
MAMLNLQSESVNIRAAAEAADYLYRMVAGNLKGFATYFDLETGRCDRSTLLSNRYGH